MDTTKIRQLFVLFMFCPCILGLSLDEYLQECYMSEEMVSNENKLPKNMFTLIEILRKIERDEQYQMDLRQYAPSLIHRFRADGIIKYSNNYQQDGAYYFGDYMAEKFVVIENIIPGRIDKFPNNSISYVERCSLHTMMSMNVNERERGDEDTTCKVARGSYQRRYLRQVRDESNRKSDCPTEDGVVLTESGTINLGSVIAGIASGVGPQTVMLRNLLKDNNLKTNAISEKVDSRWFSTLAGDLAEAILRASPKRKFYLGVNGNWNSTIIPKWYFIYKNEPTTTHYELTMAEMKGGMDGLILSQKIRGWYNQHSELRLSQILDMYYSSRGVFDYDVNSCNRHQLFNDVVDIQRLKEETFRASIVLEDTHKVAISFINESTMKTYSDIVVDEFLKLVGEASDLSTAECKHDSNGNKNLVFQPTATHLTIFLDANWNFEIVQQLLVGILEGVEVGQYNSNFTILNARDGTILVNNSNSILDFYSSFNISMYQRLNRGLEMAAIFDTLEKLQTARLRSEKDQGPGGQRSDVVLIMPYSDHADNAQEFYKQQVERIKREVPDCVILFYVNGGKDRWADFVIDRNNDLFSINIGREKTATEALVKRIKQIPQRLINTECGPNYQASGVRRSYDGYIQPFGVHFYRIHANYYFTYDRDRVPTIRIKNSGSGTLEICQSRSPMTVETLDRIRSSGYCRNITTNNYELQMTCYDQYLIEECPPFYFSVRSASPATYVQCSDKRYCRYPDMTKFTISYENLVCRSSATAAFLAPIVLLIALMQWVL